MLCLHLEYCMQIQLPHHKIYRNWKKLRKRQQIITIDAYKITSCVVKIHKVLFIPSYSTGTKDHQMK